MNVINKGSRAGITRKSRTAAAHHRGRPRSKNARGQIPCVSPRRRSAQRTVERAYRRILRQRELLWFEERNVRTACALGRRRKQTVSGRPRGSQRCVNCRGSRAGNQIDIWLEPSVGNSLLDSAALAECEWNRANRHQQEQVKRASNQMGFDLEVSLVFHFRILLVRMWFVEFARDDRTAGSARF